MDEQIRAVFMAHGFTIKEGQTDLKPYVYEAARALLAHAFAERDAKEKDALLFMEETEMTLTTMERMSQLLDDTADALRGPPKPRHRHGWADLPQVAQRLRAAFQINMLRAFPHKSHDEITAEIDRVISGDA